jgi:DNA-directed RNA polymerase subunit H (RpoH/RPB5)
MNLLEQVTELYKSVEVVESPIQNSCELPKILFNDPLFKFITVQKGDVLKVGNQFYFVV